MSGTTFFRDQAENALHYPIEDPGASGTIAAPYSGYLPIITTGAETRTLPNSTFAGQRLSIAFVTDGGNLTLTVTNGLNQAGNTTALAEDAGDHLTLESIAVGDNIRWRVVTNDGWALS